MVSCSDWFVWCCEHLPEFVLFGAGGVLIWILADFLNSGLSRGEIIYCGFMLGLMLIVWLGLMAVCHRLRLIYYKLK